MSFTDAQTTGFTASEVGALRYDGQVDDPYESTGIIIRMIPKGSRVLDVGCGTGSVSKLIRDKRGAEVIGIEPHLARAQKAIERGIDVRAEFLSESELPKLGTFDVVLFADVLEHVVDPSHLLALSRLVLRPKGCVIASVPNVAHWSVRWNLVRGRFNYEEKGIMDATHLKWFTRRTVNHLFEAAGFRIEQQTVSSGIWLPQYVTGKPWKWLRPTKVRDRMVRRASRQWPTLFGCQHVVRAEPFE